MTADNLYSAIQRAKTQTDPALAIAVIEEYCAREKDSATKSKAYFYIATLRQLSKDEEGAIKDLMEAHKLCTRGTYTHYAIETSLGYSYAKLGQRGEALKWYAYAMATSADYTGLVGGDAMESFLELKGSEALTDDERALCVRAAEAAWRTLQLEGGPDLADLVKLAKTIIEEQRIKD